MKKYELLEDLIIAKKGLIFEPHNALPGWYVAYQDGLKIELEEQNILKVIGKFRVIPTRPDWRERYEEWYRGLGIGAMDIDNPPEYVFHKMLAYLKILCYVEAANEGKELTLGRHWYVKRYRGEFVPDFWTEKGFEHNIDLYRLDDVKNMLTIPELVEALNEVFNVK